jgi:hypothetical protein
MKKPIYSPYNDEMTSHGKHDELLDQILKTDIMTPLSEDFADRVARKAVRNITLKQSIKEFLTYAMVIISTLLTFLVILYFTGYTNLSKWEEFISSRMDMLAGITLILFFVLFVDRVLLTWLFLKKDGEYRNQDAETTLPANLQ